MLATVCTCLFALAAIAATWSIFATLVTYAPDIAALRLERSCEVRQRHLAWRIVGTATGASSDARYGMIRASRPDMSLPVFGLRAGSATGQSLAA